MTEPTLETTFQTDAANDRLPTERRLRGRRAPRGVTRFLLAACIGVAATLAWQSYGDAAKLIVASAVPQLDWLLLPPPAMNPPSGQEIAVEQPSAPAASVPPAASAQTGAVTSTGAETAAATAPADPSPDLQQLEAISHDLAAVRESVAQLAAGQEQMAREIAKLQTDEQDIRRRISLPSAAARKPAPPLQAAPQLSAAPPAPPQASAPPLLTPPQPATQSVTAPPSNEPPRPPMPLR